MNKQSGFSLVAVLLGIAAIAVIGFAGYRVYQMQNNNGDASSTPAAEQTIESVEDLKTAEETLNETDIESLDTSELDQIEQELL